MSRKNKSRGFTLLEFLFAASLLAVLTAVGLFAIGRQSKSGFAQKNTSETDHIARSILSIISDEIKNAGSPGKFSSPIYFVNGGKKIEKGGEKCDPKSKKKNGSDCITFESFSYDEKNAVNKSFFVEKGILKLRNSDSSRNQSLTPDDGKTEVEDFQISFLMSGGDGFQNSMEGGGTVEAVKVTIKLKSRAADKDPQNPYEIQTHSVVANPRNIR